MSIDLAVVDVAGRDVGPFPAIATTSCANVEIPADGEPQDLLNNALTKIESLIDELPALREDGAYGLIAGVYADDPDCGSDQSPEFFCGMSTAFGELATKVWRPPDLIDDAGPPEDAIVIYLLCPSNGVACVDEADCVSDSIHSTVVECAGSEPEPCRSDEPCRSGLTFCGEEGVCDLDAGTCMRPTGDGDVEPCRGAVCTTGATCDAEGCLQVDGTACLRGTCNDETGLRLAGDGDYVEGITFRRCRSLHSTAFPSD